MPDEENLDLKIVLSLTNDYQTLMEEGRISPGQLDKVLALIEKHRDYRPAEFEDKLQEIFPEES